ncbi:hypothetical protein [Arthrobacter sp.]|jgi:BASS family bile acid:Na+ symporter|uniref:hypothetical protein n=1 Tax=Arthrobacter sp. TaxID=1667 RepID=UPI002589D62F|nr:hypothetical protein [Arthrobacter sp.]
MMLDILRAVLVPAIAGLLARLFLNRAVNFVRAALPWISVARGGPAGGGDDKTDI